ncbi:MAG TPA: hypothetical protein VNZ49_10670 [Bacteroidia bacterium]|jgi:hypothetical protein|nr:hypothetical protein [Bacteroidia bacterium]
MKGGAFGFSRKEIIWFAVILFTSLSLLIFCITSMVSKYYHYSESAHTKIHNYSGDLWNLQEISLFSVSMQRSSVNLITYSGNKKELENVQVSIIKNRDSLIAKLTQIKQQNRMEPIVLKKIVDAGNAYLVVNSAFRQMTADSVQKIKAADFNISSMRPTLHNLSDLTRATSKSITREIQKITHSRLNVFSLWEFWVLLIVLLPYLYFFCRFVSLFIKILLWD